MEHRLWESSVGRVMVGRLAAGSDLVLEIERIASEHRIAAAWVSVIGAVSQAAFAYYEQDDHRYAELGGESHQEIVGFIGNISLRDGTPFLHAHATFADAQGACVGGHLLRGTMVFAAEIEIRELLNVDLVRTLDQGSGLALW